MTKISAVISAFNEEKNITDCIKSVANLADEIIVIDNESSDKTAEIAKKYGAKLFSKPNNLMLNINKNFGFSKANNDWIFNLDADERSTPELDCEIKQTVNSNKQDNGYWIPRKNIIFGKWIKHSIWWPDEQLRLFRNGKGKFQNKHIHEYLEVEGETGHLLNPIIHENYNSITQFLYKLDKIYTVNEAESFLNSGKEINWTDSLKWPLSDFLKTYFSEKGYKDGLHGLVLSILQAFYAEVTFAKIWEKQGFKEKEITPSEFFKISKSMLKEFNYWLATMEIEDTKNPVRRLLLKIKRKII